MVPHTNLNVHENRNSQLKVKVNFVTDKAKEIMYVVFAATFFKITVSDGIFKFQTNRIVKIKR
jgi:hypothetical protein